MDEETKAALRPLSARLYAMHAVVAALIQTHPNPAALRAAIAHHQQAPLAILLNLSWPEDDLSVFHETIAILQDAVGAPLPPGQVGPRA